MSDVLYLAWCYLAYHRLQTTVLVLAVALIVFIPAALRVLVRQGEAQLTARAEATPLLLGARDSPLELALNSLYFTGDRPDPIAFAHVAAVRETGLAEAIPLHVRFSSRRDPIVGTTLDYFAFRGLAVAKGRMLVRLGDCLIGAHVARRRGLAPGDHLISSPKTVFGLADGYPLKMRIIGVLAPSNSPDDEAIFVDVKTAWVLEGLAHGHEDLAQPEAADRVLKRAPGHIVANASVRRYQQITDDNIGSFHFHGEMSEFPITAVIAVPPDHKSKTLLLGRYQSHASLQLVAPSRVVAELLAVVFAVQDLVIASLAIVAAATLALVALVFLLSLRLRRRELATMTKIGASRGRLAAMFAAEMAAVLGAAALLALGLTLLVQWQGPSLVRMFLMQ